MFRRIPPRPTRRTRFPAQKKDEIYSIGTSTLILLLEANGKRSVNKNENGMAIDFCRKFIENESSAKNLLLYRTGENHDEFRHCFWIRCDKHL